MTSLRSAAVASAILSVLLLRVWRGELDLQHDWVYRLGRERRGG